MLVSFEGLGAPWDREYDLCSAPRVGEYVELSPEVFGRVVHVRYQPGALYPVMRLARYTKAQYKALLNPDNKEW